MPSRSTSALVVELLSEQTGYRLRTAEHLVQATQSMAPMLDMSAALRGLAVDLAKIMEDLLLMSSGPRTGFAEIRLPAKQPGSSIMPGKVNPVMVENLSMICYHVIGNDTAVAWCASRGQLELNVMMPMIAHEVLEALSVLDDRLRQFAVECVAGIEADVERCRMLLEQSSAMATPLAPYIGYALAAAIAKEAVATGKTIRELVLEQGVFDQEALDAILDPFELTEPGVAGGFRYEPTMPEGYARPTGPGGRRRRLTLRARPGPLPPRCYASTPGPRSPGPEESWVEHRVEEERFVNRRRLVLVRRSRGPGGRCGRRTHAAQSPSASGSTAPGRIPDKLVLGLVPSSDANALVTNAQPLADYLSMTLGIPVESLVPTDYTALVVAMGTAGADIGAFGPFALVQAADESALTSSSSRSATAPSTYHTQWMTNKPDDLLRDRGRDHRRRPRRRTPRRT